MYRVVRRPMIITEWSFPALDSGLPCKHGAGMRVDTQAAEGGLLPHLRQRHGRLAVHGRLPLLHVGR